MADRGRLMRPFLKWAGGKYRVLPHVLASLPKGRRLVEPFVGSGAVFLNTSFDHYLLADINADLIGLYRSLQQDGDSFIAHARRLFTARNNTPERYYALREKFNAAGAGADRYALFLYLNRHGYNGLCRYNSSGGFNVPFGRYKQPYFPEAEMRQFVAIAERAEFVCADFRAVMSKARKGDVVYCDPPYVPLTRTANFTAYAGNVFAGDEQAALAAQALRLGARGVPVLISNHDTSDARALYTGAAQLHSFPVQRFISRDSSKRGKAPELLALFGG